MDNFVSEGYEKLPQILELSLKNMLEAGNNIADNSIFRVLVNVSSTSAKIITFATYKFIYSDSKYNNIDLCRNILFKGEAHIMILR